MLKISYNMLNNIKCIMVETTLNFYLKNMEKRVIPSSQVSNEKRHPCL